jgi:hypothetical protein
MTQKGLLANDYDDDDEEEENWKAWVYSNKIEGVRSVVLN